MRMQHIYGQSQSPLGEKGISNALQFEVTPPAGAAGLPEPAQPTAAAAAGYFALGVCPPHETQCFLCCNSYNTRTMVPVL